MDARPYSQAFQPSRRGTRDSFQIKHAVFPQLRQQPQRSFHLKDLSDVGCVNEAFPCWVFNRMLSYFQSRMNKSESTRFFCEFLSDLTLGEGLDLNQTMK